MDRAEWKRRQAKGIAAAKKNNPEKYVGRPKGGRKKEPMPLHQILFIVSVVRRLQEDYLSEVYGNVSDVTKLPRRMRKYVDEFERPGKITIPESPPCPALKNMKHKAAAYFGVPVSTLYRWLREHPREAASGDQIQDEWYKWLKHDGATFRRYRGKSRFPEEIFVE